MTILAMFLVFMYQTLDAIDGKHAKNIRNDSPLGELFDHACDNIGAVFQVLTICNVLGIDDLQIQWFYFCISIFFSNLN